MPFNLQKIYNQLLDIVALSEYERKVTLKRIFDRDITDNKNFRFNGKQITPTPADGAIPMETLYSHLTTVIVDKATRKREFEMERSKRLHWVKYHIDRNKKVNMMLFSVKEPEGIRTYIYDKDEKFVIVLEPKSENHYYLLTAYYLQGKDNQRDKMLKKYNRRLSELV